MVAIEGVDQRAAMRGGELEATVTVTRDHHEEACDGLLLEPLGRVALSHAGASGQVGCRGGTLAIQDVVEAELAAKVHREELEGAGGGVTEALGQVDRRVELVRHTPEA